MRINREVDSNQQVSTLCDKGNVECKSLSWQEAGYKFKFTKAVNECECLFHNLSCTLLIKGDDELFEDFEDDRLAFCAGKISLAIQDLKRHVLQEEIAALRLERLKNEAETKRRWFKRIRYQSIEMQLLGGKWSGISLQDRHREF